MNEPRDGGDAFPSPGVVLEYERNGARQQHQQGAYGGMTLRDYFAAAALPRVMGHSDLSSAEAAYRLADAMLLARVQR